MHRLADQLKLMYPEFEVVEDAMQKRLQIVDPCGITLEYCEQIDESVLSCELIYRIATPPELSAGLSEHYSWPEHFTIIEAFVAGYV